MAASAVDGVNAVLLSLDVTLDDEGAGSSFDDELNSVLLPVRAAAPADLNASAWCSSGFTVWHQS